MVDAVLWDNDGVLADTEGLYYRATRTMLARAGVDLTLEAYIEISLRQGRSTFDLIPDKSLPEEEIAGLRRDRDALYEDLIRAQGCFFPHAPRAVRDLHGKARMAVVTSTPRRHFDLIHAGRELTGFFEFTLTREDYRNAKPHPEPYQAALRRMGLRAERCIAVEDSERGLASALAAGLRCVVVPHELTRQCAFNGALAILPSVASLPELAASL